MRTIIIGDVHNEIDAFNIIIDQYKKDNDIIVQLGDLISLGYGLAEADNYKSMIDRIDYPLWGNHEYSIFDGNYKGGWRHNGFHDRDKNVDDLIRQNTHKYSTCHVMGNIIISHAGISKGHSNSIRYENLYDLKARLDVMSNNIISGNSHRGEFPITAIGYCRGGDWSQGGLLWNDWDDHRNGLDAIQIIGHTSHKGYKVSSRERSYCLDSDDNIIFMIVDADNKYTVHGVNYKSLEVEHIDSGTLGDFII